MVGDRAGEMAQHRPRTVPGDAVFDLSDDGLVSVWTTSGWAWVTADHAVALATAVQANGHEVRIGGAVDSRLGRPVAERLAQLSGASPTSINGDHPLGWMSVRAIDANPTHPLAVDLVERAAAAGETERLMRLAVRWCQPQAYDLLRRSAGLEPVVLPPDAPSTAVAVEISNREANALTAIFGAVFAVLIVVEFARHRDVVDALVYTIGSIIVTALIHVLSHAAVRQVVCFDGPSIWKLHGRRRWQGPIDLRRLAFYSESNIKGQLRVWLAQEDPVGEPLRAGIWLDKSERKRLDRTAKRYRHVSFAVTRGFLMYGIGPYLRRHIDLDRVVFGRRLWAYNAAPKRRPRHHANLPDAPLLEAAIGAPGPPPASIDPSTPSGRPASSWAVAADGRQDTMNDRYFACPTHRRHVDAGYRWARHELEEAGVVTLGQPVDVEAVMQRAAYWDVPDDEHAPWLEATLDGVRGFLDEHGGHELIYVESEFLDEQSLLGYEWREAAVTAWPAPPPE